ncbi:MAG: DUF4041 domain-containing protein [Chitinophagaceae bacterium]
MFGSKNKELLRLKEGELLEVQNELFSLKNKHAATEAALHELIDRLAQNEKERHLELNAHVELVRRYAAVIDIDKALEDKKRELEEISERRRELKEKYSNAHKIFKELEHQIDLYKDTLEISEYGLYQSKYSFDLPEQYRLELEYNYQLQRNLVTVEQAVKCYTQWEVGGSKTEGAKMTKRYTKLMLYAFNGECDALMSKVKWNNVSKTEMRIKQTFDNVNKLGASHNIAITDEYLDLKYKELALTYEYEQKKYDAKEEQRLIREQMREEEKAQKEFEKAQRDAEDEEKRYQKALDKAKQELNIHAVNPHDLEVMNEKIRLLEANLAQAQEKKQRAISLAQQTKVGHIYVISNIGSFGEDVYKIGMTRRLDPLDRVRELGDASVPFHFDIHAIIYSENAPQLEYELHQKFKERRLNRINHRKEFFRVTLEEIESFVNEHKNAAIEFTKLAEAREFRETLTLIEQLEKALEPKNEISVFPDTLI